MKADLIPQYDIVGPELLMKALRCAVRVLHGVVVTLAKDINHKHSFQIPASALSMAKVKLKANDQCIMFVRETNQLGYLSINYW